MSLDQFTNTNGTLLATHNAAWVASNGTTTIGDASIQNNQLQIAAWRNVRVHRTDSQNDRSEVTLKGQFYKNGGVSIRATSSQLGYEATIEVPDGGTPTNLTRIFVRRNGTQVLDITSQTVDTLVDTKLLLVGIPNGAGIDLEVFLNDTSVGTYNDPTALGAGYDGLAIDNSGTGSTFDVDDWYSEAVAIPNLTAGTVSVDDVVQLGEQNVEVKLTGSPNAIKSVTLNAITQVIRNQIKALDNSRSVFFDTTGHHVQGSHPLVITEEIYRALLRAANTDENEAGAIWASSQVVDGQGSGTIADPYSFRGAVYNAPISSTVILKDDGVYKLTNPMKLKGDYNDLTYLTWTSTDVNNPSGSNPRLVTMNIGKPTQESERITIRGEKGTLPVIDAQEMMIVEQEHASYITYKALKVINGASGFFLRDLASHTYFDLIDYEMTVGGDNWSPITINHHDNNHGKITRCYFKGPGNVSDGIHANTAGIYLRNVNHFLVDQVTAHNFPLGLLFKHPNDPSMADGGVPTLTFNRLHIYDTDRDEGNWFCCNKATLSNSIISGLNIGNSGGPGPAPNYVSGGNDNTFNHLTVIGNVQIEGNNDDGGSGTTPAQGNSITNSIITGDYRIWQYGNPAVSTNTSNHNLYGGNIRYNSQTNLTLAAWQAASTPASQDVNSLAGAPTFIGAGPEPADYALNTGSLGEGTASDASNMGCGDISNVGAP